MGMVRKGNSVKYGCSVCIANYNGIRYIEGCLKSVMEQDCPFPVEIIVHDDASTDDSVRFIEENWPHVRLIKSRENVGFCIANNRMVKMALGEYILLLNNDALLFPNALRLLYEHSKDSDRPAILSLPQYNAETGELIDRGQMFDLFLNPVPNLNPKCQNVGMVMGACFWLSKNLWEELGGFPEWFHSIAEDMYLCCAARLKGYSVQVLKKSGYRHWVGASFGGGKVKEKRLSTSVKRRALSERNKTFVMVMCYPVPFFHILFPVHILLLVLEGISLAFIKKDRDILFFIYAEMLKSVRRTFPNLSVFRQIIHSERNIGSGSFFSVFSFFPHKFRMLARHGVPEIKR